MRSYFPCYIISVLSSDKTPSIGVVAFWLIEKFAAM